MDRENEVFIKEGSIGSHGSRLFVSIKKTADVLSERNSADLKLVQASVDNALGFEMPA